MTVNQARNLLINVRGNDFSAAGEEYVPPDYVPKTLTPTLGRVYAALFGQTPDRAMLNYRAVQLLTAVHRSDLSSYVYGLDARVTYWPFDNCFYDAYATTPSVTTLNGTGLLNVSGWSSALTSNTNLADSWTVLLVDASTVKISRTNYPTQTVTTSYTITNGLSDMKTLPGSGLGVTFGPGVGNLWSVSVLYKPTTDLADLWDRLWLGSRDDVETTMPSGEPYDTFRAVWRNKYQNKLLRLGAATLGYVYSVNALGS